MLESRSEDALVLIVKLVKSTVETVETEETVLTEDLKKSNHLLTYLLTDSLKARDASASKNVKITFVPKTLNQRIRPHFLQGRIDYISVPTLIYDI